MDSPEARTSAKSECPLETIDFVDSPDIRAYWEAIGWNPSPLEASFIIWSSRVRTIAEKHIAWRHLIETAPDESFPKRMLHLQAWRLHAFLTSYMHLEKLLLDDLRSASSEEDHCCWIVRKPKVEDDSDMYVCLSFEQALRSLRHRIEEEDWCVGADRFIIIKRRFDTEPNGDACGRDVSAMFSPSLEPIALVDIDSPLLADRGYDILVPGFEDMWFNFPLPFRKGDILVHHDLFGCETRFVLARDATLDPMRKTDACVLELREERSDCSDMLVNGYGVDEESGVVWFHGHMHDILAIERFSGELEGFERKLEPLGRFAREEIDLEQCLRACEALDALERARLKALRKEEQFEEVRVTFGIWSPELHDAVLPPDLLARLFGHA